MRLDWAWLRRPAEGSQAVVEEGIALFGFFSLIAIQFATFFGLPRFRFASGGGTSTGLFFINERSSPDIETMCVYSYIRWTFASG
jgi:hypothetical protein